MANHITTLTAPPPASTARVARPRAHALPTLSRKAHDRAAALRRLADDLEKHHETDPDGDERLVNAVDELLNGSEDG